MSLLHLLNYGAALLMVLFGIFVMITVRNLLRKVIGLGILQTGIILFYVSLAYKHGAALPIVPHHAHGHAVLDPAHFANPLPHALMLTAIVVGVSLLGVALTLIVAIYRDTGSMEEDEVLKKLETLS